MVKLSSNKYILVQSDNIASSWARSKLKDILFVHWSLWYAHNMGEYHWIWMAPICEIIQIIPWLLYFIYYHLHNLLSNIRLTKTGCFRSAVNILRYTNFKCHSTACVSFYNGAGNHRSLLDSPNRGRVLHKFDDSIFISLNTPFMWDTTTLISPEWTPCRGIDSTHPYEPMNHVRIDQ